MPLTRNHQSRIRYRVEVRNLTSEDAGKLYQWLIEQKRPRFWTSYGQANAIKFGAAKGNGFRVEVYNLTGNQASDLYGKMKKENKPRVWFGNDAGRNTIKFN